MGLKRSDVRDLKRVVRTGLRLDASEQERDLARASALALLEQSMHCGHDRLAVLRLGVAIQAGACVTPAHWRYCEGVVSRTNDSSLRNRVVNALQGSVVERQAA